MTGQYDAVWIAVAVGVAIAAIVVLVVWRKGRPFAQGDVFRASRLSSGNHLFPTQVLITPTSVVQFTPRWIGRHEETIHMAHVSSVKIDTRMMLSDVLIETSGGSDPIVCHGHHKRDAVRIQELIEQYQTDHYRQGGTSAASERVSGAGPGRSAGSEKTRPTQSS